MSSYEKFKKYSIYDVEYKIGEDTFVFKPLSWQHFPKLFSLIQEFQKVKFDKDKPEEMMKLFTEDTMKTLLELEKEMVKVSYPDLPEDDIERFVMSNFMELVNPLFELAFKQEKFNERKVNVITQGKN